VGFDVPPMDRQFIWRQGYSIWRLWLSRGSICRFFSYLLKHDRLECVVPKIVKIFFSSINNEFKDE